MAGKIRLIASDLDGTLLQNGQITCNEELFPLLDELKEQDVYFVPASGRQYGSLLKLFHKRHDKMLYLCENGALVMYQDQVIYKNQFEDSLALDICHTVYDNPCCEVLISGERTSYLIPKSEDYVRYVRDDVGNDVTIIQKPEEIMEPIIKVSYFTKAEDRDPVTADFQAKFRDSCQIVTSGNRWVDFAPSGTSKGSAMEHIGNLLNIASDEMAAFGDNENDRTMLGYVGHPYIMENCNPTIRDIPGESCYRVEQTLRDLLNNMN